MNWLYLNVLYMIFLLAFVEPAIMRNPTVEIQIHQILMRHNFYRRLHHAKPLKLDKELSDQSLKLAENMAHNDRLSFSRGVNVFARQLNPLENLETKDLNPVDFWYQEVRFYHDEGTKELARNFTQLVWNSSKKLGVGIALSTSNILYVVCKYDPPGNVDNAYKYNVFERIKDNNSKCESILESDQFPYFRHAKGNSGSTNTRIMKDAASSIETVEKNYSQIRSPNHYDGEIEWWSIFDNIMGALASELHLLLLGSHDHSVEKRDLAHLDIEDFEETIRNELKSLSRMTNTDTDTLSGEKNDNTVLSAAKTYCQCCCEEETDPSKDPCNCSGSAHNKCDCQRLTTLEILSRKIDMVLVFTVFNNIFMIIFGVAVTLGVVVQWCTGPGMNKRRR